MLSDAEALARWKADGEAHRAELAARETQLTSTRRKLEEMQATAEQRRAKTTQAIQSMLTELELS